MLLVNQYLLRLLAENYDLLMNCNYLSQSQIIKNGGGRGVVHQSPGVDTSDLVLIFTTRK